jgi:hypothetical protein
LSSPVNEYTADESGKESYERGKVWGGLSSAWFDFDFGLKELVVCSIGRVQIKVKDIGGGQECPPHTV